MGKTALAIALVTELGAEGRPAELFSLDAMAVYRGMDVGTSKPTPGQLKGIACRGIDLVEPCEEFAVPELMAVLRPAMREADRRGGAVIAVGGTGLYVRALIDNLEFPGRYPHVLEGLEAEADTALLYSRLLAADPSAAEKILPTNRRRIIRALEVCEGSGRPFSSFGPGLDVYPETDFLQIGLSMPRPRLDARIARRLEEQLEEGLVAEVRRLVEAPGGMSLTARQALGYREIAGFLAGECTLSEAKSTALRRIVRFARRQERWFRRDPRVRWLGVDDNPEKLLPQVWELIKTCA